MTKVQETFGIDSESIRSMLSGSGYSDKAIMYYLNKYNMGSLSDADQETELTGPCGDTMKLYLKVEEERIMDAKIQVLGCPGAIASAMAAMDLIKGITIKDAMAINEGDIFNMLEEIPDQKQHCIQLTIKTIQKAIEEYKCNSENNLQGDKHAFI